MWVTALQLHRVPGSLLSPHSQTWGSRRKADPREEGLSVGRGITEWKEIEGNRVMDRGLHPHPCSCPRCAGSLCDSSPSIWRLSDLWRTHALTDYSGRVQGKMTQGVWEDLGSTIPSVFSQKGTQDLLIDDCSVVFSGHQQGATKQEGSSEAQRLCWCPSHDCLSGTL